MERKSQNRLATGRRFIRDLQALGGGSAPLTLAGAVLAQVGLVDRYWQMATPLGPTFIAYGERGVTAVMPAADAASFEEAYRSRFGRRAEQVAEPPAELVAEIAAQLGGRTSHRLRFDLEGLTEFEKAVLRKTLEIPFGEVRPYGWIAREIGRPGAVRAVGTALGNNPIPLLIPCHRVVRSDGRIGNYAFGGAAKRAVLEAEGVDTAEFERLAAEGVRYVGSDTTKIFCLPTCRHARRVTDRHRVRFRSEADAAAAGYRPCKVCRPGNEM